MSQTSRKREEKLAKELEGERQPGSGNTPWHKEDVKTDIFLVQHKETTHASISIKAEDLRELRFNAVDEGKEPLFIIEFESEPARNKRFFLLNEGQFTLFQEAIR